MKAYTLHRYGPTAPNSYRVALRERNPAHRGDTLGCVQLLAPHGWSARGTDGVFVGTYYRTREDAADALLLATTVAAFAPEPAPVHPDDRAVPVAPGLAEVYEQLTAAVDAAAALTATAQRVLPDDVSRHAFLALQSLCALQNIVMPAPSETSPF